MNVTCRFCGNRIEQILDLGDQPLANSFLKNEEEFSKEEKFPLTICLCESCGLVQLGYDHNSKEIFNDDYIYFSRNSEATHNHAKWLVKRFEEKFGLKNKFLIEIASNDGTVLKYFKEKMNVLGIEPTKNTADYAVMKNNIPTIVDFFSYDLAKTYWTNMIPYADFILARNVFAHVPDIHPFVKGLEELLNIEGVIAIENPYMAYTILQNKFDTIYHEHYSYLSVKPMKLLFERYKLELFDIDEVDMQGGSLIYYIGRKNEHEVMPIVKEYLDYEENTGLTSLKGFKDFARKVQNIKEELLTLLLFIKSKGKRIAAYSAPAKGNTLLNYCGIDSSLIDFAVDKGPEKQGKFMPGSHIPIFHPDKLEQDMPEYTLLLSWNIQEEVLKQQKNYIEKGGRFIIPIPKVIIV